MCRNESWPLVVRYAIIRGLNLATNNNRAQLNTIASTDLIIARCYIKHGLPLSAVTKVMFVIVSVKIPS